MFPPTKIATAGARRLNPECHQGLHKGSRLPQPVQSRCEVCERVRDVTARLQSDDEAMAGAEIGFRHASKQMQLPSRIPGNRMQSLRIENQPRLEYTHIRCWLESKDWIFGLYL